MVAEESWSSLLKKKKQEEEEGYMNVYKVTRCALFPFSSDLSSKRWCTNMDQVSNNQSIVEGEKKMQQEIYYVCGVRAQKKEEKKTV